MTTLLNEFKCNRWLGRNSNYNQARRQGGFKYCKSGPLVSLLLRVTAVQTSLVAATECELIHGRPARYYTGTRVSCLRRCDERTRILLNTCVNKSPVQTLESCPSSDAPTVLPTLVPSLVKIRSHAGLVNVYMDSQKLDAILREPYSYYSCASVSQNGLRSNLRASNFKKISWGKMPTDHPSLACLHKSDIHVAPPSKNPGYGPDN